MVIKNRWSLHPRTLKTLDDDSETHKKNNILLSFFSFTSSFAVHLQYIIIKYNAVDKDNNIRHSYFRLLYAILNLRFYYISLTYIIKKHSFNIKYCKYTNNSTNNVIKCNKYKVYAIIKFFWYLIFTLGNFVLINGYRTKNTIYK
jgi:hypothetical protein